MTELERVQTMIAEAQDTVTVRRVYGEPIERDGALVIPAAAVMGGAGGGSGTQGAGQSGTGMGFGMRARPVGAFVIRDGNVTWEPVVDPQRQAMIAAVATTVGMLALRSITRRRGRRRR